MKYYTASKKTTALKKNYLFIWKKKSLKQSVRQKQVGKMKSKDRGSQQNKRDFKS